MKNKRTASTLGLIMITVWAAMQYIFLRNVPDDTPTFSFLCLTNVVGLALLSLAQFKDYRQIRKSTVLKGMLMAGELVGFNFFLMLGSRHMDSVAVSSVLSMYFIFVVPLLLLLKREVSFRSVVAAVVACVALLLTFNADFDAFKSFDILYLLLAEIFFACYVVTISILGENEPSGALTICQMAGASVFSLIFWFIEIGITRQPFHISADPKFWVCVAFIGVLIRALYSRIQIACQKNVPPVTASLIYSSEIVITLILDPLLCRLFGTPYTPATVYQVIGCVLFVISVLVADDEFMRRFDYDDMERVVESDENGKEICFKPVSRKIVNMNLVIAMSALLLSAAICFVAIFSIRDSVVRDSDQLGQQSAMMSETALTDELEKELDQEADSKAKLAGEKLSAYAANVYHAAAYAGELLSDPLSYPARPVYYPDPVNADIPTMQRVFTSDQIREEDVRTELEALGNMESIYAPILAKYPNISACYLGTSSGIFISYDEHSGDVEGLTETVYYDFINEADWYKNGAAAKDPHAVMFTDVYQDNYGHGLTITCYSPVYDRSGAFRAVLCFDILMADLNAEMVSDGIEKPVTAMLIDANGGIIAGEDIDPKSSDRLSIYSPDIHTPLTEVSDTIFREKNGVTKVGEGSEALYVAYSTVEQTGWTLCVMSPVKQIIEPAVDIRNRIDDNTRRLTDTVGRQIREIMSKYMVLFAVTVLLVTYLVGKLAMKLTRPLKRLESDVKAISDGNLDRRTKVMTYDEIGRLAKAFNSMTSSLQHYITDLTEETAKRERLNSELSVATNVQLGILPGENPDFPDHDEFELCTTMHPAKEVGGDFYDYFLIDDSHLGLVIADVSGKGVPAALFMVIAKTMIKNRALMGGTPSEILSFVNNQLCENNSAEMFVTVWMGILDLKTGVLTAANAGHEFPAIRRKDGKFELLKDRHGFVVAGMENSRYTDYELKLEEGDTLFVYTDGVAEANNENAELFGTDNMLSALNSAENGGCREVLSAVSDGIRDFVREAPQFDDITMLCIRLDHYKQ